MTQQQQQQQQQQQPKTTTTSLNAEISFELVPLINIEKPDKKEEQFNPKHAFTVWPRVFTFNLAFIC